MFKPRIPTRFISSVSLALGLTIALGLAVLLLIQPAWAQGQDSTTQSPTSLQASVGTAFTYQGRLLDGGKPANGPFDFRFRLFDAASGGSQVGTTVTLNDVQVTNGLFTVALDFGAGAFKGDARWLEIAVRPGNSTGAYTTLSPRQPLRPAPYALALPGLWTEQNAATPNIIGGYKGNTIASGTEGSVIIGGGRDGSPNRITFGDYSVIAGGEGNTVENHQATVSGGTDNTASGYASTVGGGRGNIASGYIATIGGGDYNQASQDYATVAGGQMNHADAITATIGGGEYISVTGQAATVAGGSFITVAGDFAAVAGGTHITVTGDFAAVGGGSENAVAGDYATIGGGVLNSAAGRYATVGGGQINSASGEFATVAGGWWNAAVGRISAIGGGVNNIAVGEAATIPGGANALADHDGQLAYAGMAYQALPPWTARPGDLQYSLYVLGGYTFPGQPTDLILTLDVGDVITIANNRVVAFDILIAGAADDGAAAAYTAKGVIRNLNGNTAILGGNFSADLIQADGTLAPSNGWSVSIKADDSQDALIIHIVGPTIDTTTYWVATVQTAEVIIPEVLTGS